MVRIAENLRSEELEMIERINKYNLALIAFSSSFLSFIISYRLHWIVTVIAGLALSVAIVLSLLAIYPRKIQGGAIAIDDDIKAIQAGKNLNIQQYLFETADITSQAAQRVGLLLNIKKIWTISSAGLLAFSVIFTYIVHVCQIL